MKLKKPISLRFNFRSLALAALALVILSPQSAFAVPSRQIAITAAVSSNFKNNPEWQKEIKDRIMFANGIFEKQFGVFFSIKEFKNWEPEDEKRETSLLIEELRSQFPINADEIVIGFHKMGQPFAQELMEDLDTVGTAQFFRGYVILRDPYTDLGALQRQIVMAHELAHLFGAIHIADSSQIMHASLPQQPALTLDADNSEIIENAKQVDFQIGAEALSPASIDKLIQIYERLIRKNPHSDFYYQLGHFYDIRGLHSRAVAVWEEAVRYEYTNPVIHWELGREYYESSRYDLAIRELGTAVAHFILPSQRRQRAQAFNFLGVAYYRRGNLEQAIFNWLKGLSSDPDSLELQGNLAAAYMENGDTDRAISELLKLSVKYPDDVTTLSNLSVAYLRSENYEKSVEYARKALDKYALAEQIIPETAPAAPGENPAPAEPPAEKAKSRLIEKIPESSLHADLGAAYAGLQQWDDAIKELLIAKGLDPQNGEVLQNLAFAYTKKQDYPSAIPIIEEALSLSKENAQLYYFLAEACAMTGKRPEAIRAAQAALPYADKTLKANLHKNIGILYAQDNHLMEAIASLKTSLSVNWSDADTHLKLGYFYGQAGNPEEARRSFQNALRIDPQHQEAKKALESFKTA